MTRKVVHRKIEHTQLSQAAQLVWKCATELVSSGKKNAQARMVSDPTRDDSIEVVIAKVQRHHSRAQLYVD